MFVCFFGFRTGRQPVDCPLNKCRQAVTGCPTAHWLWWGIDLINYQFERDLSCLILWANGGLCVCLCSQLKFSNFIVEIKKKGVVNFWVDKVTARKTYWLFQFWIASQGSCTWLNFVLLSHSKSPNGKVLHLSIWSLLPLSCQRTREPIFSPSFKEPQRKTY